jgi:hypothetical protein
MQGQNAEDIPQAAAVCSGRSIHSRLIVIALMESYLFILL